MTIQFQTIEDKSEREKIIHCARDYYMKEGFYKTSMDTLAAELRMSKKTIYKYFPSKEILVEEVVNDLMLYVQRNVNEIMSRDTDAVIKVKLFHELLSNTLIRFNEKWLNDVRIHAPRLWVRVDEFRTRKMFAVLSGIFDQGKKEGLIDNKPNEILVTIFIASIRAIVNPDFLYIHKYSYSEAVDFSFDILFNGCLTREGKKTYNRKLKENRNENSI